MTETNSNSDDGRALVIDDPEEFGNIHSGSGTLNWDGFDLDPFPSTGIGRIPDNSTKTEYPSPILVCSECRVYFEYDDEWAYCPKCSSELAEVVRA